MIYSTRFLLLVPTLAWALSLSVCAQDWSSPGTTSQVFQPPPLALGVASSGFRSADVRQSQPPSGVFVGGVSSAPNDSSASFTPAPYSSLPFPSASSASPSVPSDGSAPGASSAAVSSQDAPGAGYEYSPPEWPLAPHCSSLHRHWWVRAEGLYWGRVGDLGEQVLAVDLNNGVPGSDTVLKENDLELAMEPGWRVLVGVRPFPCQASGCCPAFELSYFGGSGWEDSVSAAGDGNLAIPGVLGLTSSNFFLADEIRAVYRSQLHNAEANWIQSAGNDSGSQLDFFSGFRFVALNEDFALLGTDVQGGTSSYDVSADNYLYGIQLGGRVQQQSQRWGMQVAGKAGVFLNDASQRQTVIDDLNTLDAFVLRETPRVSGTSLAMLGEVELTLMYRITNTWSARIGYSVLAVNGLALAPSQLDFNDTFTSGTALFTDGFAMFHGAHAGLEAAW